MFPSAALKRNLLSDTLTEAGVLVDSVTSYITVPNPNLSILLREKFDRGNTKPYIFVFFSPSGVNAVLPHLSNMIVNLEMCKVGFLTILK